MEQQNNLICAEALHHAVRDMQTQPEEIDARINICNSRVLVVAKFERLDRCARRRLPSLGQVSRHASPRFLLRMVLARPFQQVCTTAAATFNCSLVCDRGRYSEPCEDTHCTDEADPCSQARQHHGCCHKLPTPCRRIVFFACRIRVQL